ncbi:MULTISPECIES: N-acetyltransferase [unclassified Thalassospira]|uniref:GNAT family N-acetyltransferase n=1 Tax=unclassified Thalassospira TaxID=2648997 RepID=UPI0007AD77E7|nr:MULTISPECIES: N-acetyltransferase [unclassified Thalassospira]MEE3044010.1 N-acetyltransferase [Pseudomonadota bacterium]KZB62634.1 acetyltransferase [Thalassospira sp. MCCC 1A02491]MAL39267.1 N-acetyltransferase [Thalassospira sp.]MBO6773290.1 GNAT family N-acetyltransferase [Thalassospira sp.]HAY49408.1 N-acetyltransferase [Thalassospira sp.]|tara:strand:+ start:3270 stop:3752 length:483 start_codon:yes stop_codon:yes gene_type:complete
MNIRLATDQDIPAILDIVAPTLRSGETYAIDSDLSDDDVIKYWMAPDKVTLVAEEDGNVVGTYYIRQNQGGGGSHVCNCGYMTSPKASGRGIARRMCEDSLVRAKELGYRAMQFNFVIASNAAAVHLWPKLGFEIVGRLPGAFMHPTLGETDALVMYRKL